MSIKTIAVHRKKAHPHGVAAFWAWLRSFRHYRLILEITGVVILVIAGLAGVAQFFYPQDKTLPYMAIGGLDVGSKDREVIEAQLTEYAAAGEVTIATPSKEWRTKWQSVGLTVDPDASATAALSYEWWERLMPFSSVIKIFQSRQMPLIVLVDEAQLEEFSKRIVAEDRQAAFNATISIKNGAVVIDDAKNGYVFNAEDVASQVRTAAVGANTTLRLVPQEVPFLRSREQLRAVAQEAEKILTRTLLLSAGGKTFEPTKEQMGEWLRFTEDDKKQIRLEFNQDALKKYLETLNKEIAIDSGTVTATLLDGQEIARTAAPQGRSLATEDALKQIQQALMEEPEEGPIPLKIADVPPRVNYVRTYSQSSAGLTAIIQDWERENYGDYGVIVREVGGERRYAEWQPDKSFVTASTFKMFVAYALLTKISRGEIRYDQKTDIGWTVDACLTEMIINSTNPCAISFLNLMGWAWVDGFIKESGFGSTLINNVQGDKFSTVRDETNFLLRLHAGTLMNQEGTDRLLGMMKRQVWRWGVPSGVPRGVTVANKVGFYGAYVHDVAIVYAPKGVYILGVMSRGGHDYNIADLSRRVYRFFNG